MQKRRALRIENPTVAANESRWTDEITAKFGKVPDAEIAKQLGCKDTTVTAYRQRHEMRTGNYARRLTNWTVRGTFLFFLKKTWTQPAARVMRPAARRIRDFANFRQFLASVRPAHGQP